jgi:ankyrin repeat protein
MNKKTLKNVALCSMFLLLPFIVGFGFFTKEKPIHRAAYKGDLNEVKKIIEKDPNQINIQDELGKTPLYYASSHGHNDIVEFLLAHNANIELGNILGERPLAKAAYFKHYDTVKTLLEHGAMVNYRDESGRTPLHDAACYSGKDIIDILISYGADVSAKSDSNYTPLHQAVESNNIEAAKALVEHGADIFAKNTYDCSPSRKVSDMNDKERIEYDVYCTGREIMNKTPKEMALRMGRTELAQYLQTKEDEKRRKDK